jgi:hypothetical protein
MKTTNIQSTHTLDLSHCAMISCLRFQSKGFSSCDSIRTRVAKVTSGTLSPTCRGLVHSGLTTSLTASATTTAVETAVLMSKRPRKRFIVNIVGTRATEDWPHPKFVPTISLKRSKQLTSPTNKRDWFCPRTLFENCNFLLFEATLTPWDTLTTATKTTSSLRRPIT